jgi:hypothetical protein
VVEYPELHAAPSLSWQAYFPKRRWPGQARPSHTKQAKSSSGVSQIETAFDPFDAAIDAIEPIREIGVLALENAKARLHLAHVVAQAINRTTNVPQMLKHDALGFRHRYFHSILVIA